MSTRAVELRLLDQDLAAVQRAEVLLAQGRALREEDPRLAFEMVHRAALRAAGVLVAQADRVRRRRLPLNVWTALERLGPQGREWSLAAREFVAERARLERDLHAVPDDLILQRHLAWTAARILEVREEMVRQLESAAAPVAALAG